MTDFRILGEGFLFPEGPVAFPDGSLVFVEIAGGNVTRLWGDGKSEVIAHLGGGPNGAALGPDGALYVCNNGGMDWTRGPNGEINPTAKRTDAKETGRIERVDLGTGSVDRIYDCCDGRKLGSPNDIVFDAEGAFWFTDFGRSAPGTEGESSIHYALPDGSIIVEAALGSSFNGVGLSPGGGTLYAAETMSTMLWAWPVEDEGRLGEQRLVGTGADGAGFDSLALTDAGNICVATLYGGAGMTTFTPDGDSTHIALPDMFTTNICFGGTDRRTAFITLAHTGKIIAVDWPEPGLALHFNPY